ncbi:phosphonate C-P lyase system protein PhnH [Rhodococcus sp. ABRD24]|uniref:phosphonate C-P lyase system protein PhnH n=1 Tax=Rhodococcus sp. ABRD24 TaxID=2507582 RepID=UPI0010402877|nr:phosphonate C-P lyase system protein PhnH [Rhodococcus sp. ABRD24]QBJ96451.1 phosphonate C-P lyase system protein PhnH [Rhodococcus sp. ABRD24]
MTETLTATALCAGLNPDLAQRVYRAIVDAFARPGIPVTLPDTAFPPVLLPTLALADLETGVHLLGAGEWDAVVAVATAAPTVDLEDARFVTAVRRPTAEEFGSVTVGTPLSPESGATVICAVDALTGGDTVELTGPGVRGSVGFAPTGFDPALWTVRNRLVAGFPAGIDLLFVALDGGLVGLPRTTVVATGKAN